MPAATIMHLFLPKRSAVQPEERPPMAVPAVYVEAIAPIQVSICANFSSSSAYLSRRGCQVRSQTCTC